MIKPQRMAETFMDLVKIDSLSRSEGRLAADLRKPRGQPPPTAQWFGERHGDLFQTL